MGAHARLSPSSAARWMLCPGSVSLSEGLPDSSSAAANEGTNAHYLLEYCLKNTLEPVSFIGQVMTTDAGVEFTVSENMAYAVATAYDYVMMRVNEVRSRGERVEFYVEVNVTPTRLNRLDCSGTADVIIETNNWIEVIDYKHGEGVIVNPEGNRQMQIYGIGSLDTLGLDLGPATLGLDLGPATPLLTTIIQPRAPHEAGPIRTHSYSEEEVVFFTEEISQAATLTDQGGPFLAGKEQCRWCRAKATCKTLAQHSLEAAQAVFTDLTVTDTPTIQNNLLADPTTLTDDQVVMVLSNETLIRGFLDAVHARAVSRLQAGEDLPGYKLVAGRNSRKWKLGDEKLSKLLRSIKRVGGGKVTIDDIHTTEIKSPAAIEKMLKGGVTKAAMQKIKGAIVESEGAPQLAPSSSSKRALPTKATDMFEDISTPSFLL